MSGEVIGRQPSPRYYLLADVIRDEESRDELTGKIISNFWARSVDILQEILLGTVSKVPENSPRVEVQRE